MKFCILTALLIFSTLISPAYAKRHRHHPQEPRTQNAARSTNIAYYAIIAETGEVIASHNEDVPFNPASNAKLVTSYCALKTLGIDYRFKTGFYSDTPITDGAIHNLFVRGGGDPSIMNENLQEIIDILKSEGLKKITGNIVADASFFDNGEYPGRKEDNERPYNARTSATSLNHNSAEIIAEGTRNGPLVYLSPNIGYFKIQNRLKNGRGTRVGITSREEGDSEVLTVVGHIPRKTGPLRFYKSVRKPPQFFAETFKAVLRENGIEVLGEAKTGMVQGDKLLLTWESKPLDGIVEEMNKFSNNFIAEQLTKYLGAKKFGPPGTTAKGIDALKNCLAEVGVDTNGVVLENGSGLSYNNLITAQDLVKVLLAGTTDSEIKNAYISSLSVADVDGTMRKRHTFKELRGVLRGKTGTLNAISSLAGVVPDKGGKTIVFAILLNDFGGGRFQAHRIQDSLVLKWVSQ